MNGRLVAAFRGVVHCRREAGAVQWCLAGLARESGAAQVVLLSGAAALQLPPQLPDAAIYADAGGGWELRSPAGTQPLGVRAIQVHRAAPAFAAALPRIGAPWLVRAGWVLLLELLRIPGLARLAQKLRG
jgi:hypothetical protein